MMSQQLSNYRLLHQIGHGAFAEVYLGEHISDKTQVAIKVLRMDMAATDVESFIQEAQTITRLEHPHIIRVLEYGVQENTPFFVMQYAANGTLRERHPKGAILTPISILPYIQQIASALQYAHDNRIIHRDMKPENVLLGQYNEILLSDFGLAVIVQSASYQQNAQSIDGTLAYMAPEQFLGKARAASDQYALAVIIYEWLSGSRPFIGTPGELRAQHMQASPERLCGRGLEITPAVEHVVLTALAKDPYQRFPSVQDFATAFEQACSDIPTTVIRPWNIAHRRNTYFTGREDVLKRLHEELRQSKKAALTQAITGLGGIGKTQTVVEYAYRYRPYYKTILWVNADSLDLLLSNFAALAEPLHLPEKTIQDQSQVVKAVKRWLETHTSWLLIFDNIEDPELVRDFLPSTDDGHILLTTRTQVTDTIAQAIELDKLTADEGALLLLRRARIIEPDAPFEYGTATDRMTARAISELLDGLPLALDQAGAYIEGTECSLSDYLHLYEQRHAELLRERGRFAPRDNHPDSVAATLSLSFEKALQANSAAADLLRLCAFLHPDAIPEEIITDGAPHLGRALLSTATDQFKLDTAIGALRKYSLIRRNSETHTLTIHRLVQAILKDRMNQKIQRQWAERAVRAVNRAFPDVEPSNWQRCQRLLSHAEICSMLIQQNQMTFPEAARLLHQAGRYLGERAQYSQAEAFLRQTLKLREQTLGPDHLLVADSYDALAKVYLGQGRYSLSEATYQRALAIREKALGPDHPDVVISLNNIAGLSYFVHSADYDRSEQLLLRALAILEKARGPEHLDIANNLDLLGNLYDYQGRYADCIPLCQRALAIREKILGPHHLEVANTIYLLGRFSHFQGLYDQAKQFYQQALAIWEGVDPEQPEVGDILNSIALLFLDQGQYAQAESLLLRTLTLHEKVLGLEHHNIAKSLNNLAFLYQIQGRYAEVEPLAKRALRIHELNVGPEHPDIAIVANTLVEAYLPQARYAEAKTILERASKVLEQDQRPESPLMAGTCSNWADLYFAQGKYNQAEAFYRQALTIREKVYGPTSVDVAQTIIKLAKLYLVQGKYTEAEIYCNRALEILEKDLGSNHPDTAQSLQTLAAVYVRQGRRKEAEQLCQRALSIYEQTLGGTHPYVAQCLQALAEVYFEQGKYSKARPLYERARIIREKIWQADHPEIAQSLNSLAELSYAQHKYTTAKRYGERALAIREKILEANHPDLAQSLSTLASIYQAQSKDAKAESLYKRALEIFEHTLGFEHPSVSKVVESYAALLHKSNRESEAVELKERARRA